MKIKIEKTEICPATAKFPMQNDTHQKLRLNVDSQRLRYGNGRMLSLLSVLISGHTDPRARIRRLHVSHVQHVVRGQHAWRAHHWIQLAAGLAKPAEKHATHSSHQIFKMETKINVILI